MKKLILAIILTLATLASMKAEAGSKKARFFVKTQSMVKGFVGPIQTARMTPIQLVVRLKRMGFRHTSTELSTFVLVKKTRMGRGVLTQTYFVTNIDSKKITKLVHGAVKKSTAKWNRIMKKKYGRK